MGTDALDARRLNVDRFLTGLSIAIARPQNLIGDQILPVLKTDLSTEKIVAYGTEAWRTIEDKIGDFSPPQRVDISADKISVEVDGHALENPISYRQAQESIKGPAQIDLEQRALLVLNARMALNREKGIATLVTATGSYGATHKADLNGLGTVWSDNAIDPIDMIVNAVNTTVPNDCGEMPNVFWASNPVWAALLQNTKVKNRIFGLNNPQGTVTGAAFASLIGVPKILVGRALSRTAAGVTTQLWGNTAGLAYVPPATGQDIPAFGYTVEQRVFGDASEAVVRIEDQHMGASGGYYIKRSHFWTAAITFQNAGYLWYNAA